MLKTAPWLRSLLLLACTWFPLAAHAQVPPTDSDKAGYTGLLAAAATGDAAQIRAPVAQGTNPDMRDSYNRTPLHVAAGANPNVLERDRYDIVTVAAVANDLPTLARERRYAAMMKLLEQAGAC